MTQEGKHRSHRKNPTHPTTVRSSLKRANEGLEFSREPWPLIGAGTVALTTLVIADLIGVGELILATAAGYGAFQMLRKKKTPMRLIRGAGHLAEAGEQAA